MKSGILYGIKFINPNTQETFLKVGIAKYRAGKVGLGVLQRGSNKDFYIYHTDFTTQRR